MSNGNQFPKTSRLLHRDDFFFNPWFRYPTDHFLMIYTTRGQGRIGISLSKKILRRANQRNRIRRLIRESFRLFQDRLSSIDIHVIGKESLGAVWQNYHRKEVDAILERFIERVCHTGKLHLDSAPSKKSPFVARS